MEDIDYTFSSAEDARAYLREIGLLWGTWIVGLVAILLTRGTVLMIVAAALFVALLALARPLLPRTEVLVPENKREGGALNAALRGGTTRDRVLRELAYGVAPMSAALEATGNSQRWVVMRHAMVAVTLVAFVFVVVVPFL
ncbi:MAG: hypothetical protein QNJ77_12935 [Acidimicrobiia bacterium]|nr:hypothetical protein [Acidimicrobiia bacterium]